MSTQAHLFSSTAEARSDQFRFSPTVILALALGLACLPLLALHALSLWDKPHYQFFPWALLGAGVLAWQRRHRFQPLQAGSPLVGYTLLGLGWLLLATAGYLVSPWLGMVAVLFVIVGYVVLLGGRPLVSALFPSFVLLLVLVPPPLKLDTSLILLLQGVTVNLASRTLDWLNFPHLQYAHTLQVPGDQLFVDEACSGIVSLFSVVTFALFFSFAFRRNFLHLSLLLLFAALFVLLGNVIRVVAITMLKSRYGLDLVNGWKHELTGLLIFLACVALTASMDQLLLFFLHDLSLFPWCKRLGATLATSSPPPAIEPMTNSENVGSTFSLRYASFIGAAFMGVGLVTVYNAWIHPHALRGESATLTLDHSSIQQKINADFLPRQIGRWQVENYERKTRNRSDLLGQYSDVWRYRQGKQSVFVSVDYPFRGGHDLTRCYTAQGWYVKTAVFPILLGDAGSVSTTAAVTFERSTIEKGHLWFSEIDDRGHWLPADDLYRNGGMNRLADRFSLEMSTTVQVQIFLTTLSSLEDESHEEAQKLFQEVRALLYKRLFATGGEQP